MTQDEFILLDSQGGNLTFFGTFPANPYPGQTGLAPRWPLLASAPATVVDGQRFRLSEAPREFGREHLGVGGAWVPQDSVTMGVWQSMGGVWSPITDTENPNEACIIPIKAGGNGSEVATLILTSEVNCTVFIDGTARFYTDAGGTLGESSTTTLTANVQKSLYIRLASGTSTIYVEKCSRISSFGGFTATTNSPTLDKFNTYYTRNAKNIVFNGPLISISGTTYPWANVTQNIVFSGNLISVSGTTYPWANATQSIFFNGPLISISGTTYPWANATQNIVFSGNLISVSGTTYPWANVTQSIIFSGNLIMLNHPISLTTGTKYNRWFLKPAVGYMPSADVDRLLIDIAATWTSPSGTTPQVDLRGNCGARTSASNAAVSTLTGRGITVLTN